MGASNPISMYITLCTCWMILVSLYVITNANECPCNDKYKDISPLPDVFESTSLPSEDCCLPSVGNGYLATVVYSDTIFVNGVYNGRGGESQRARIPSTAAIDIKLPSNITIKDESYSLNLRNGTFYHKLNTTRSMIMQRIYAHQTFPYLLINEIVIQRIGQTSGPFTLQLVNNSGIKSNDINFKESSPYKDTRMMYGTTVESETSKGSTISIAVNWTAIPKSITLQSDEDSKLWTFITAIGPNYTLASAFYAHGIQLAAEGKLYTNHTIAWQTKWSNGHIDVDNVTLSKAIHGSMYYILSSLPSVNYYDQEFRYHFYGLSPGGLAHGDNKMDYQGHIFWDQETWMYPTILMLHPLLGRAMLESRTYQLDAAKELAKSRGYKGAEYPWEMAYSGAEVCPNEIYSVQEIHINGDIAFAVQQYLYMTEDIDFLKNSRGYEMILELAKYWESRVEYNNSLGHYEINDVKPPDEYQSNVKNSVYTNTVAEISLRLPEYAAKFINASTPSKWVEIANKLIILYDDLHKYHPEFEGYERGTTVKQADVILLGFPLNQRMAKNVRKTDLQIYESVTDPDGPAMSWAMFSVGCGDVHSFDKRDEMFQRSFENIQEPFKVWTETSSGSGAINFITGMGGFLQSVLFGYGGFRIHQDHLLFEINLPQGTHIFRVTGLDYLGSQMNIVADLKTVSVTLTNHPEGTPKLQMETESGDINNLIKDKTVRVMRSGWISIKAQ